MPCLKSFLCLAMFGCLSASTAWADPPNQTVGFVIREDPEDPKSDVEFFVFMELKAGDTDPGKVGWSVESINVTHYLTGPNEVWEETAPTVPTADGLWWVEHVDTDKPTPDEFADSPPLAGVAKNFDSTKDDLDYEFQAMGLSASSSMVKGLNAPRTIVIALVTYKFIVLFNPPCPCTTIGEGEDEDGDILVDPEIPYPN